MERCSHATFRYTADSTYLLLRMIVRYSRWPIFLHNSVLLKRDLCIEYSYYTYVPVIVNVFPFLFIIIVFIFNGVCRDIS